MFELYIHINSEQSCFIASLNKILSSFLTSARYQMEQGKEFGCHSQVNIHLGVDFEQVKNRNIRRFNYKMHCSAPQATTATCQMGSYFTSVLHLFTTLLSDKPQI